MTQLSGQQAAAIERIKNWYGNALLDTGLGGGAAPFKLFGYAGTGKTTLAKEIGPALGISDVRFATFTGKAAHVLRSKGANPVTTIHSGIYLPTSDAEVREKLKLARVEVEALEAELQGTDEQIIEAGWADRVELMGRLSEASEEIEELEAASRRLAFEWNEDSEWAQAELIVLDEVSMVNAKIAADVERYGVPVLVLGDPGQLPPVDGGGYYTSSQPDFLLTKVHRQAKDSPVLDLATRIRESEGTTLGLAATDVRPASVLEAMEHDQVLCWTNKRRWAMVDVIRRKLGRQPGVPSAGDRIMCLSNNRDIGSFNGEQFEVLSAEPAANNWRLTVRDDEGRERTIPTVGEAFLGQTMQEQAKNSGAGIRGPWMLATFAQAITVHKAQGSQWRSVYVVNETPGMISMTSKREGRTAALEQARRWLYTAATRAEEHVTITAERGR